MMNIQALKDTINKLREINAKDLQYIVAWQVARVFRHRVDILINIILVFATVIVLVVVSQWYSKISKGLKWEISQMEEQGGVIKDFERLRGEYEGLMSQFPKVILTDSLILISKLSEMATFRHVHILSFSPMKEEGKEDEYIKVATVQINAGADNYQDLMLFMKDIEDSPFGLRVEQWSAKMKEQGLAGGTVVANQKVVEARMNIASIRLKDE